LQTIIEIEPLYKKLKDAASKIILFGSSCRGEDTPDSDTDLFIVSHSKDRIEEEIKKFHSKRKIQAIVRTNLNFNEMKQTEPDFYEQVIKGIVLWEAQDES
jgi:predicted nucleotidyltransferase